MTRTCARTRVLASLAALSLALTVARGAEQDDELAKCLRHKSAEAQQILNGKREHWAGPSLGRESGPTDGAQARMNEIKPKARAVLEKIVGVAEAGLAALAKGDHASAEEQWRQAQLWREHFEAIERHTFVFYRARPFLESVTEAGSDENAVRQEFRAAYDRFVAAFERIVTLQEDPAAEAHRPLFKEAYEAVLSMRERSCIMDLFQVQREAREKAGRPDATAQDKGLVTLLGKLAVNLLAQLKVPAENAAEFARLREEERSIGREVVVDSLRRKFAEEERQGREEWKEMPEGCRPLLDEASAAERERQATAIAFQQAPRFGPDSEAFQAKLTALWSRTCGLSELARYRKEFLEKLGEGATESPLPAVKAARAEVFRRQHEMEEFARGTRKICERSELLRVEMEQKRRAASDEWGLALFNYLKDGIQLPEWCREPKFPAETQNADGPQEAAPPKWSDGFVKQLEALTKPAAAHQWVAALEGEAQALGNKYQAIKDSATEHIEIVAERWREALGQARAAEKLVREGRVAEARPALGQALILANFARRFQAELADSESEKVMAAELSGPLGRRIRLALPPYHAAMDACVRARVAWLRVLLKGLPLEEFLSAAQAVEAAEENMREAGQELRDLLYSSWRYLPMEDWGFKPSRYGNAIPPYPID